MTANHNFLFNGIITVALAIPSVGAQLFDSQMVRERAVANAHRLSLPEKLNDGWNRVPDSSDKSQSSVFVRTYANAAGEQLIVMVRQTPRFEEVHDFNYCLIANGLKPKLLGVVSVATSRGNLSATEIATQNQKQDNLSLLWFENDACSAPDRWHWRMSMFGRGARGVPICREYRVLKKNNHSQNDLSAIESVSAWLFEQPL